MRLDVTHLPDEMVEKILAALGEIEEEHSYEKKKEKGKPTDDALDWWYDTDVSDEWIFKTRVIKISGEVPYNSSDKLEAELRKKLGVVKHVKKKKESAGFNTRFEMLNGKGKDSEVTQTVQYDLSKVLDNIDWSEN
jgi:hypothetical protein